MRLAALALAIGSAALAAQEHRPAPFERILYLQGKETWSEAAAAKARALGFTSVMTADVAAARQAKAAGLGVVLDQVAGKGVLELRDPEWLAVQRAYSEQRDATKLVRPAVLADPETVAGLSAAAAGRVAEFRALAPWAVSLGDEVSITRHRNPLDLCMAEASLASFRDRLRRRFESLDALNLAFGTTFPTWEHARPFTADEIRQRELGHGLPRNLMPWAEHRAFMDAELARVVGGLAREVRAALGEVLVGLYGMQPPAAYGGHDLRLLLPGQSGCEVYAEGGALPLARSLAGKGTRLFLTLTAGTDAGERERVLARVASCVAEGLAGVIVYSSAEVFAAEAEPTPFGVAVGAAFAKLAPLFARAGPREVEGSVWILESQAAVRGWWMLDSAEDGKTWVRRLSSYEATHSTSLAAREGWWELLTDLGVEGEFVAEQDLEDAARARPRPKLLVLPAQLALGEAALRAIRALAAQGTVVVADHEPGLYDQDLVLRAAPPLDARFGIERLPPERAQGPREGRPLPTLRLPSGASAAEPGLTTLRVLGEKVAGTCVQVEHFAKDGVWCYLNLAVCEYPRVRLDPERVDTARDLRRRVQRVLDLAKVLPRWPVKGAGLPTCLERAVLRGPRGERTLVIRVDALAAPSVLAELARSGPRPVELYAAEALRVRDVLGGGDVVVGTKLAFPLDVWSGLFLELAEPR